MRNFLQVLLFVLCALCAGWLLGVCGGGSSPGECCTQEHRDTVLDTVVVSHPVARDSVVVRYVRARLPSLPPSCPVDTVRDTVEVGVPISQVVYEDGACKAWVSGYLPRLDSIHVYHREVTNTIVRTDARKRRLHVVPSVGVGLGADFKPGAMVGVGITYY